MHPGDGWNKVAVHPETGWSDVVLAMSCAGKNSSTLKSEGDTMESVI